MTAKPTILLILSLTTVAFSASTATEPNETTPEPTFETGTWLRGAPIGCNDRRVRFIAELIVIENRGMNARHVVRTNLEKSPLIQRLSQAQKDFLADNSGVRIWTGNNISKIKLFAVSEADAEIMAWALLDSLDRKAHEDRAACKRRLDEAKQELQKRQLELAEKEKRLKEIEPQYNQQKENLHPHLSDDEVVQLAKELIFQMDKQGNTLDIELAGIRAKLGIIEEYLQKHNPKNVSERLEAMKIDQMIELGGLEARREAIEKVRTAEQGLYSLYSERLQLNKTLPGRRGYVKRRPDEIKLSTAELERTSGWLVPPQNEERKVTIYPIEAEDSQT